MSKPAVSVLIRVRDEEERLGSTLSALSGQILDQPVEVVVLDNESADASAQLALEHGARVFTFPRALFGYGRALNLGIEMCRADIVVLLSSHSAPESPSWLSDLVQPLRDDAAVGAVFCRQIPPFPMARSELKRFAVFPAHDTRTDREQFAELCRTGGDPYEGALFSNSACAVRRDAALRHPFRDLPYSEDRAFVVDLVMDGGVVAYRYGTAVLYDRRLSWKGTYLAHYRCQVSRRLIREQAAAYTGREFSSARETLRKTAEALFIGPVTCWRLLAALREPRELRRRARRHAIIAAGASLGTAKGCIRWRGYRPTAASDSELLSQAREQCRPMPAASA